MLLNILQATVYYKQLLHALRNQKSYVTRFTVLWASRPKPSIHQRSLITDQHNKHNHNEKVEILGKSPKMTQRQKVSRCGWKNGIS